ncbi:MAG TPA: DUF308 domain-containing protein [Candidatus Faecousia faecavium]|nr:DUF308 domain-containing protein [Candidatus Faecousia faecavium]
MISNNRIQTAKLGYIIISAVLCVLGIVLITVPDFSALLLCRIGGLLLIIFGFVKIIGYCSKDLYRLAFQYDLAFGILLIALGATLILRTETMVNVIWVFLGISILADALLKIQIAIDSKVFGLHQWWLILATAILTGMIGFLVILRLSESAKIIMVLLGTSLLFEGVLNMVTILTAVKIIRNQKPVIVDSEF